MKHIELFENFLFEADPVMVTKGQKVIQVSKQVADYIKKSPKAMKSVEYCNTLVKAMAGSGTDEAAIFSVFSKIKTKGEMIQILAIWDMLGYNYDVSGQGGAANTLRFIGKLIMGNIDEYDKKVSGRLDKMGRWAKDTFNSLDFWNKADTRATDAYYKERAAWYKKYPSQRSTSLFYWLREDLNEEELAKINGMIKKFGMKISA
jgi:hypothetical protein